MLIILAGVLGAVGQTIHLMSPEYGCPYVKANNNYHRDAAAVAKAETRPTMRLVAVRAWRNQIPEVVSGALASGDEAHGADQPFACVVARTRHCRREGPEGI